ncbi:ANTAR domain-containing protein [Parasphingorhabdus pacifica]
MAESLSFPMIAEDEVLGPMTLYSVESHVFGSGFDLALLVVDLATNAFSMMLKHAERVVLAERFRQALDFRSVIDQVKGMVMLRHGCSAADAFCFLRRRSLPENIKLRAVASAVVEGPVKWLT